MSQDELLRVVESAIARYCGDGHVLESAIGALFLGLKVGWRPLHLMHRHNTLLRYQEVLDLNFREALPEVGPLADKMLGWRLAKKAQNFWDAVRGTAPGRTKEFI
jgi:hypothetical protein